MGIIYDSNETTNSIVFEAKDYGAVADGTTDSRAAINSAIDAAAVSGGVVQLEAGTYIVSGTGTASDGAVLVKSNVTLQGKGMGVTILKLQDSLGSAVTGLVRTPGGEVTQNVTIKDLTIDGNKTNNAFGAGAVIGTYCGVTPSQDLTGITRSGSTATATTANTKGISNGDTVHVFAEDPDVTEPEYLGDFTVANVVSNTSFEFTVAGTPTTPATGNILFYPSSEADAADYDITYERVEIKDCNEYGFDPHERVHRLNIIDCVAKDNGKDNYVADYILEGEYSGNYSEGATRHGYNLTTATKNFILANNISKNDGSNGIVVQKGSGNTPDCRDITIENNVIDSPAGEGMKIRQTHNFTVQGNILKECAKDGMEIKGSEYGSVTSNIFTNNGTSNNDLYSDIQLLEEDASTPTQYIEVSGNILKATGTNKVKYHIEEQDDSSNNNKILDNNYDGGAVTASVSISSSTSISGNTSQQEGYITNNYYYPKSTAGSFGSKTLTAGREYYVGSFVAKDTVTVTRLGIDVATGTGTGGDTAILGIYTDKDGLPHKLVGTNNAEVAIDATAQVEATVSCPLVKGRRYWMVVNVEANVSLSAFANSNNVRDTGGTAWNGTSTLVKDTIAYSSTLAATSSATASDYSDESIPVVWFRVV